MRGDLIEPEPEHYEHRIGCGCYECKEEREVRREKPEERESRGERE